MKATTFLLFAMFFQVSAAVFSQNSGLISLKAENESVREILLLIEDQSKYRFLYNSNNIDVEQKKSIDCQAKSIEEVLDMLLKGTNIKYRSFERNYVLYKKDRDLMMPARNLLSSSQQPGSVSGKVTDSDGQPLPGVSIVIKGTTQGTVTNVDGEYTLSNVPPAATLVFSFVGMRTQEIAVGNQTNINVTMEVETIGIEEVVAIGYGTVRRRDLTGSVGSIKGIEIKKQPVTSLDQALQGRIPGVQVTSIDGSPGTGATIRIRGGNSIWASNEPLYVIDGFIGGGDLSTINPSDIESIEILKDASATAIYGSRGSNGVILITTKRGTATKGLGVSYNSYVGIQTPVKKIDLLKGPEYAEYKNEYDEYIGNAPTFTNVNEVKNTDWQEIIFRDVPITDHNLNFYYNTETSNYFVSLNYLDQKGIKIGSSFQRYQMRLNFDQKIGNYLKVGASINGAYSVRENPRATAITSNILPTAPVYNEDGTYFSVDMISGGTYNNPVAQEELISDYTNKLRSLGNIYIEISPIKGLNAKSSFGFDFNRAKRNRYEAGNLPTFIEDGTGGHAYLYTDFDHTIQNENTIDYIKKIGNHEFKVLGGWTLQKFKLEELDVTSQGFYNDVTTYNAIETGDPELLTASSGEESWSLLSALFRLNYNYKGKYLFTVTGREDGASRLAEGNKWQFFPSAAFAWRVSDESFIKQLDFIHNLKLRASYGKVGSHAVDPYATLHQLTSSTTYIGNKQVVTFVPYGRPAGTSLKWEVTDQIDFGIDLGLFKNRLNFVIDYYYKKTNDLILAKPLPYQTGFSARFENVGSLQNKGFEFQVDGLIFDNKNFSWASNISVSFNKNKVLELSGDVDYLDNGTGARIIIGEPVTTFYGFKFIGLWQEGDESIGNNVPGSIKWEDVDGDGRINWNDGQILGKGAPDFYGGWNNILGYKNFTLSMFFDFSYGNDIYDLAGRHFNTGHNTNVYGKFRNRWTPTNTDTDVPRAGTQFGGLFFSSPIGNYNDMIMSDGSYLRLKTLNLQYDIPVRNKLFKSLAIYSSMTNVFTLTKYEGFTPDVNSEGTSSTRRGFDNNAYPPAKVYLLGIKANF